MVLRLSEVWLNAWDVNTSEETNEIVSVISKIKTSRKMNLSSRTSNEWWMEVDRTTRVVLTV